MKNIKIVANNNKLSKEILSILTSKLKNNEFNIVTDNPDLVIAIGGDGAFLRMVKKENYCTKPVYVGINAGTLGFLQEIKIDEIDKFIDCIKKEQYKIEEIGIQETTITTVKEIKIFNSINEIVVREKDLNTAFFKITIDDNLLENYAGDGILVSTSIGSTAYNLSFGGAIVPNHFHILQITPIAPLNSNVYRNLLNSVIAYDKSTVKIEPKKDKSNILISIDGENKKINNVIKIETKIGNKKIKLFHLKEYDFFKKVNEKFLV